MTDPKSPKEGEHIEELLSQLKGIFGHLSDSEKEEARQKIVSPAPKESAEAARDLKEPIPDPLVVPEPAASAPSPELDPNPIELTPMPSQETPSAEVPPVPDAAPVPNEVTVPPGAALVPTAVFYPTGRINEAKIVAEKVERITPKFTKVSVVINVQALSVYEVKADLKSAILPQIKNTPIKAVFILVDKAIDDVRRKALLAELEPQGIYFQEIPFHQIEKKALYTDMLLGMVFFFDSQKPAGGDAA